MIERGSRASVSRALLVAVAVCVASRASAQATATQMSSAVRVLDDFEQPSIWTTHPSDGVTMRLSLDAGRNGGKSLRIDFAFSGGGYAIVRRSVPIDVPPNYLLSFYVRGASGSQNLEVKLVDSTGDNVWWRNQRDFEFSHDWRRVAIKKRQVEFAWGPLGGGELRRAAALEIAITAGSGGRGTVWLDDLSIEERPVVVASAGSPIVTASSTVGGSSPSTVLDSVATSVWRSQPGDRAPSLTLDFRVARELGGLTVDWADDARAVDYDVQTSDDGLRWDNAYVLRGGKDARDHVALPETETRMLRLLVRRAAHADGTVALRSVRIQPLEWSASRNAFFTAVSRDAPRGNYPKYFSGQQSYWTTIGVDGDTKKALINEQGALEVDRSTFSIEPFLFTGGRLITWADVQTTPALLDRYLPIPSVEWRAAELRMTVTAFAAGKADSSVLYARYRVVNESREARDATLFLALRPFQVNPPAQFLNTPGGVATVRSIAYDGRIVRVDGDRRVGSKSIIPLSRPSAFGAATFDAGTIMPSLRRGELPPNVRVADSLGAASAALAYRLTLAPGASRDVWVAIPLHNTVSGLAPNQSSAAAARLGVARLEATRRQWHEALDRVTIELPPSAARLVESIRANLAYMLIARDGPALQPGTRSYKRAWIRDGAMMSAALLRLGHGEEARAFAEWYAPFQYPNGKVPCCVDARGADPVPENDSHGQLVYLIAEYYRYTGDRAFLARMWPHVARAVSYIDSLRQSRMTPEYREGDKKAFYGLVPQSISHEGYSAKAMHSYWDDLFTLRGLRDAVEIAAALGREPERTRYAELRDEFRRDLVASYRLAMQQHGIDYLPGAVELGDFDATSTTVGVSPGGELETLPHPALERTFEKYYTNFVARRDSVSWVDYTPYELRVVGTMVRLGWRDRALEALDFFAISVPRRGVPGERSFIETVRRRSSSATCRTPGLAPTSFVPRSICSRTSARATHPSSWAPASLPHG